MIFGDPKHCLEWLENMVVRPLRQMPYILKPDMISSSIVIVGLATVLFFKIPNADAYAALIISCMIIYTSLGLGKRTVRRSFG